MNLSGRWAVVTGAGNGIGRGIVLALAEAGASSVAVDIDEAGLAQTRSEVEALGHRIETRALDLCRPEALQELADELCPERDIALLCNNAGVGGLGKRLLKTTEADMRWIMDVNLFALWRGCAAFGRHFAERTDAPAWIVNTGSEHSLGTPPNLYSGIYTASKHAVLGMSDVLRRELPEHVGVSVLCPGLVHSSIWRSAERRPTAHGGPGEVRGGLAERAMQEGVEPVEIGRCVVRGVENGEFLIVTHSHSVVYAEERHREVAAAFADQAPRTEGDFERYAPPAVLKRLLDEEGGAERE
ncbi:MAG: SDR family NAD(P)-dependent oxidoreductase [Gammaproteobacteria bacterium AqS3]|nr:SDR family NAD(P)-dependent oxidoreductase [Gammaproteobacteria bacterium AqS3]